MSDQPGRSRPAPAEGTAARPAFSRRLLLVHAHPDDESINNGVTMAKYAAEGALVTLVTCTRGEEGEVIPPELASPRRTATTPSASTASASWPPRWRPWASRTTVSSAGRAATGTPG